MAAAEKRKHYYWRHDTQDVTCHSYLLALRVCVSVCVCVCSSHLFWVAVPPIKARRGYTLQCIWRGLHVFSVLFCLTRTNRVVQEGVNTRRALFFFSFSFCAAPSSCGSAFILLQQKAEFCVLHGSCFSFLSPSTYIPGRDGSEKKKKLRREFVEVRSVFHTKIRNGHRSRFHAHRSRFRTRFKKRPGCDGSVRLSCEERSKVPIVVAVPWKSWIAQPTKRRLSTVHSCPLHKRGMRRLPKTSVKWIACSNLLCSWLYVKVANLVSLSGMYTVRCVRQNVVARLATCLSGIDEYVQALPYLINHAHGVVLGVFVGSCGEDLNY